MTAELRSLFEEYATGRTDLGMLLINITRIEGDVPISRLNQLLDQYYADVE